MKKKYIRPENLDQIIEQIQNIESLKGTITVPGPRSPVSDQLKFKLCQQILKFKIKKQLTNSALAKILKVNQTRVSEICRSQYHLYTIDRLIDLIQILSENDKELKLKIKQGLIAFN